MEKIDQLIFASIYAEFPDTLLSLELAIAFARLEKRNVSQAMRHVARIRKETVKNRHLKNTLTIMAGSLYPTAQLIALTRCLNNMRKELDKQMKIENLPLDQAVSMMQAETALMNK